MTRRRPILLIDNVRNSRLQPSPRAPSTDARGAGAARGDRRARRRRGRLRPPRAGRGDATVSSSARRRQSCSSASRCRRRHELLVHVRDYTKGHPSIAANNHPVRHGPVVGIHNGIIVNDDELLAEHACARAEPRMTVDSEAIFALAAHSRSDARAFEVLHGAMAAAWLDERDPELSISPRGVGRPLWLGEGREGSSSPRPRSARDRRGYCGLEAAQARGRRGHACSRSWRQGRPRERFRATRLRRGRPAPGRAGAARARGLPEAARGDRCRGLSPAASEPSGRTSTPSRAAAAGSGTGRSPTRRGASRTCGRPATRSASRASSRRASPSRRTSAAGRARAPARALPDRPLEPLLADRDVVAGLAQRVRERAEGMPVERLRRHPAAPLVDVPRGRHPAELLAELAQHVEQLLARREPPRHEPGRALRGVPGAEVLDHGLRMHLRLPDRRRTPSSSATGRVARRAPQLREDLLVGVALADRRLEDASSAGSIS